MNLKSLVVVALRLMALNFLFQSVIQFLMIMQMYKHLPTDYLSLSTEFTVVGGMFICTVILWCFALPIAKLATHRLPRYLSLGTVSLVDCYSIAFIGMGLFYSIGHLAAVLHRACSLFKKAAFCYKYSWIEELSSFYIAQEFIPFIIGFFLFLYSRKWAELLAKKHTATTASDIKESDI